MIQPHLRAYERPLGVPRGVRGRVTVTAEDGREARGYLLSCFHVVPLEEANGRGRKQRAQGIRPQKRRCTACAVRRIRDEYPVEVNPNQKENAVTAFMSKEDVARVCHEVNRAYCASLGDASQLQWEQAPDWQRDSAVHGVEFALVHPDAKPSDSHDSWLKEKVATGWKYGPVKDAAKREHPCFVPYEELPPAQRAKDALFLAVVRALEPHLTHVIGR